MKDSYQAKVFRNDTRTHLLKINLKAFPTIFVPTIFTNFCVVIATLLITVKLKSTSMLGSENMSLSASAGKRVSNSKKSSVKDLFFHLFNQVSSFEDF